MNPALVTPLMWKSLDTLTSAFQHLWTFSVEWDPKTKLLIYNKPSRKLVTHFASIFFLLPLSIFSGFFLLFAQLFGHYKFPLITIILTLFFLLLGIFGIVVDSGLVGYGDDFAAMFNVLNSLEKSLQPVVQHIGKKN
jgi:hypothetical protein